MTETYLPRSCFKTYTTLPDDVVVVQAWDPAVRLYGTNPSAGVTIAADDDGNYYVLDAECVLAQYAGLKRLIAAAAMRFRPSAVLIDDSGIGSALLQDLRDSEVPVRGVSSKGGREDRFLRMADLFLSGRVLLPVRAAWLGRYFGELTALPHGERDDLAAATAAALLWMEERAVPRRVRAETIIKRG